MSGRLLPARMLIPTGNAVMLATEESAPRPVYLSVPPGPMLERCAESLRGVGVTEAPRDLRGLAGCPPGVVLVDAGAFGARELAEAAAALPPAEGWTLCALHPDPDDGVAVRTVSLGGRHTLDDLRGFAGPNGATGGFLTLHGVLVEIAQARHDLNNPLTSALAEVQLLLLDAEEGPDQESLLIIQEQLRRLRDRLLATRHLRPGDPRPVS